MPFTIEQFSKKASRDVRSSMALALARHARGLVFNSGAGPFQFAEVFEEWPSYLKRYIAPSACVLPGSWTYGDAYLTPTLIENTWEPAGEQGFGLYKQTEIQVELELSMRTNSVAEREAILLVVESAFRHPQLLMSEQGGRNGILLPMPEYYGCLARFALVAGRVIDDEDRAVRENRDAILTISAQATQVVVGPVAPLSLKVRQLVGPEVVLSKC